MSSEETIKKLKEQLEIADTQIKRLVRTERRLLDLEEKIRRILKRYKALQEISNFIISTQDISKIFEFVCEKFVYEMDIEKVVVLLKETDFVIVKEARGYKREEIENLKIKKFSLESPFFKKLLEKEKILIKPEENLDPIFQEEFKLSNLIGFVIFGEKKSVLGFFLIGISKEKLNIFPLLTEEEIMIFSPLATQLATSIYLFDLIAKMEEKIKEKTAQLTERVKELEIFTRGAIERELKMIELKEEIKKLKEELKKYKSSV